MFNVKNFIRSSGIISVNRWGPHAVILENLSLRNLLKTLFRHGGSNTRHTFVLASITLFQKYDLQEKKLKS